MEDPGSVLVVEDEALVASSLVEAFESSGFVVSLCGTGFDALNYIEMEDDIVAVVTDVSLGEGPDGWEVARRRGRIFPMHRSSTSAARVPPPFARRRSPTAAW